MRGLSQDEFSATPGAMLDLLAQRLAEAARDGEPMGPALIPTDTLRRWIRARECEAMTAPTSEQRQEAQRMLDFYCAELGRRGDD